MPIRALAVGVEHLFDAGGALQQLADGLQLRAIVHVDMRDLVIGDGERAAGAGVEQLASELDADTDQPVLAEYPVDVDGLGYVADPVFGQHDHARVGFLIEMDQIGTELVHLPNVFGGCG